VSETPAGDPPSVTQSQTEPWPSWESDGNGWPTAEGDQGEFAKQLDLAKLEVRKKRTDQEIALNKAESDADIGLESTFYESVFDVAKGALDRTRASADFVQKGASAIVAIYAAVLGVAFSVSDRPLPARGLIPALFLGLAIVCATFFLAWLPTRPGEATAESDQEEWSREQIANTFILWINRAALGRGKWLRASVVALAAGLLFLPAPFVSFGTTHRASTATTWPQPRDAAPTANVELRKILYQAQVDQAAAAKPQPVAGKRDWIWWVAAAVALLLVALLPQIRPRAEAQMAEAHPPSA
jgi:hypothetical protein